MNQQLRIIVDPTDDSLSVERLELWPQFDNGNTYQINSAELYVYDGSDKIASGTLLAGDLHHINAKQNSLYYEWSTSENATLSESAQANYRALWLLNSNARRLDRWFNVVHFFIKNPISLNDIFNERPELITHNRPVVTNYATADGTSSTLTCKNLNEITGFYDGGKITFDSGSNERREVKIDEWNFESKQFTLLENLDFATKSGDRFEIERSFTPELNTSWNDILIMLNSWVPKMTTTESLSKLIDGFDLYNLVKYYTLEKIMRNLRLKKDDSFDIAMRDYGQLKDQALLELQLKLDSNTDGEQDEDTRSGIVWQQH